jgi:hypothetical protein
MPMFLYFLEEIKKEVKPIESAEVIHFMKKIMDKM